MLANHPVGLVLVFAAMVGWLASNYKGRGW
jgi:hypothetical protein